MARAISHVSEGHRLELVATEYVSVNGKKSFMDRHLIQFLHLAVQEAPGFVSHRTIQSLLSTNMLSESAVHKMIGDLNDWLEQENLPKVVLNKRSKGYCLRPEWLVDPADDPVIDDALDEIRKICEETRAHVRSLIYEQTASGLQYVAAGDGLPQQLFNRLHAASWKLMLALAVFPTASASLIIRLKNALFEIVSYVTFWRLGTRYEEAEWKDEFDQELKASLDVVEILVARIMGK